MELCCSAAESRRDDMFIEQTSDTHLKPPRGGMVSWAAIECAGLVTDPMPDECPGKRSALATGFKANCECVTLHMEAACQAPPDVCL